MSSYLPCSVISDIMHNRISVLKLNYTHMNMNYLAQICDALKQNTSLIELLLEGCNINDNGVKLISNMLKVNTTLTTLHLYNNIIEATGAKYISKMLKQNTTLTTLDLAFNIIGDNGVMYICKALTLNKYTGLTKLYLHYNKITSQGVAYINELLKQNTTLITLFLSSNQIGKDGIKLLLGDAIKVNKTLRTFYINYCELNEDKELTKFIIDCLQENGSITDMHYNIGSEIDIACITICDRNKYNIRLKSMLLVDL
jgi:Ran GTPase-activating protein (RanGAP) involved in mRNA processing and transport